LWFGLGVLLGPIGFALAFTTGSRCEKCGSKISSKAEICPNCGHEMRAPRPSIRARSYASLPILRRDDSRGREEVQALRRISQSAGTWRDPGEARPIGH
jgi:hypothetical protein